MANLRQSILVRTDLTLPVGLLAAQIAHLHFEPFRKGVTNGKLIIDNQISIEWMNAPYLFVHKVPNFEVLSHFCTIAKNTGVTVTDWSDTIYLNVSETQRIVLPNVVIGVTLGPDDSDNIKAVIGDLPLL
jgi:peptidyl-tRNA hydrolase